MTYIHDRVVIIIGSIGFVVCMVYHLIHVHLHGHYLLVGKLVNSNTCHVVALKGNYNGVGGVPNCRYHDGVVNESIMGTELTSIDDDSSIIANAPVAVLVILLIFVCMHGIDRLMVMSNMAGGQAWGI
jgi:hypothetical protein